jgi:transposase
MTEYVGLDVSLEGTSVCILDDRGRVIFECHVVTDPEAITRLIRAKAPRVNRVGLETGQLSVWLSHELRRLGLPIVCMDARHAHAALSVRPVKTDKNDARGLAQMVRMGWYREVKVKTLSAHEHRSLLMARQRLIIVRRQIEGQVRGLLKTFGLVVGAGVGNSFVRRVNQLADRQPSLSGAIRSLLNVLAAATREIASLDKEIGAIARANITAKRLMTVPGVGPLTALAYVSTFDDPTRFRRSADVGAYLGLTPRHYQSGEIDRQGRISKHGDRFLRTLLYEAANVLMTRVKRWSPLKAWGQRLSKRIGAKKAKIAVARKLAIILHCIWTDGTEFWWSRAEATMT